MESGAGVVAVASADAEDIGNSERGDGVVVVGTGAGVVVVAVGSIDSEEIGNSEKGDGVVGVVVLGSRGRGVALTG